MAGDLILSSVNDETLTTLTNAGGVVDGHIFHANKYAQTQIDLLKARNQEARLGATTNNRSGLPPHFYISFKSSDYKGSGSAEFKTLIRKAIRPLTIVSSHSGLSDWNASTGDEVSAENCFRTALQRGTVTLEVYAYNNKALINPANGKVNENVAYMKLVDE